MQAVVSPILRLESRWNGAAEWIQELGISGRKRYGCSIEVNSDYQNRDLRWRTMLHELLHAHSVGLNRGDLLLYKGWEEGVVEKLQRLLRNTVLSQLGVVVDETILAGADSVHRYNSYIAELERLRECFDTEDPTAFYIDLLKTPLPKRPDRIKVNGETLPSARRYVFDQTLMLCNARLRKPI